MDSARGLKSSWGKVQQKRNNFCGVGEVNQSLADHSEPVACRTELETLYWNSKRLAKWRAVVISLANSLVTYTNCQFQAGNLIGQVDAGRFFSLHRNGLHRAWTGNAARVCWVYLGAEGKTIAVRQRRADAATETLEIWLQEMNLTFVFGDKKRFGADKMSACKFFFPNFKGRALVKTFCLDVANIARLSWTECYRKNKTFLINLLSLRQAKHLQWRCRNGLLSKIYWAHMHVPEQQMLLGIQSGVQVQVRCFCFFPLTLSMKLLYSNSWLGVQQSDRYRGYCTYDYDITHSSSTTDHHFGGNHGNHNKLTTRPAPALHSAWTDVSCWTWATLSSGRTLQSEIRSQCI